MKATRSYILSKGNEQIFFISYLCFSPVIKWKKNWRSILTKLIEVHYVIRHDCNIYEDTNSLYKNAHTVSTRNKPDATIYFFIVSLYLFS